MSACYVIADIGANHDGRREAMSEAIRAAKQAGADAVKFQWTSDPVLMASRRGKALADGYAEVYARYLHWPEAWLDGLAAECASAGIDFMCTVFIPEDVQAVAPYVARFKVASFEAEDMELLAAHKPYVSNGGKRLVVSLGMGATPRPTMRALGGYRRSLVDFLLCVSAYPTPVEELGLAALWCVSEDCGDSVYDGFSDHTDPALTLTGALAVAAGASIVEAHLRLDSTDQANPDYPHAMTPAQFTEYVRYIRLADQCVGERNYGPMQAKPCEASMMAYRVRPEGKK